MKIDPVFLVAPAAPPPTVPTRRAFLLAGGAFAFGSMVGGACGYSIGAAKREPVEAAGEKADGELGSSGDAQLDELRRLAVKAPIEEFVAKWNPWWGEFDFTYTSDPILWQGLNRLAAWAIDQPDRAERQMLTGLITAAQKDNRPAKDNLSQFRRQLEEIRAKKPR